MCVCVCIRALGKGLPSSAAEMRIVSFDRTDSLPRFSSRVFAFDRRGDEEKKGKRGGFIRGESFVGISSVAKKRKGGVSKNRGISRTNSLITISRPLSFFRFARCARYRDALNAPETDNAGPMGSGMQDNIFSHEEERNPPLHAKQIE